MPENDAPSQQAEDDAEALVARALTDPGVAEIVAVYEAAESIYVRAANAVTPCELAGNSTDEHSLLWGLDDAHVG